MSSRPGGTVESLRGRGTAVCRSVCGSGSGVRPGVPREQGPAVSRVVYGPQVVKRPYRLAIPGKREQLACLIKLIKLLKEQLACLIIY